MSKLNESAVIVADDYNFVKAHNRAYPLTPNKGGNANYFLEQWGLLALSQYSFLVRKPAIMDVIKVAGSYVDKHLMAPNRKGGSLMALQGFAANEKELLSLSPSHVHYIELMYLSVLAYCRALLGNAAINEYECIGARYSFYSFREKGNTMGYNSNISDNHLRVLLFAPADRARHFVEFFIAGEQPEDNPLFDPYRITPEDGDIILLKGQLATIQVPRLEDIDVSISFFEFNYWVEEG